MQTAHDVGHIMALTRQPGLVPHTRLVQHGLGLRAQGPVSHHDQPLSGFETRCQRQRQHKRLCQHGLVFHRLHTAYRAYQPVLQR